MLLHVSRRIPVGGNLGVSFSKGVSRGCPAAVSRYWVGHWLLDLPLFNLSATITATSVELMRGGTKLASVEGFIVPNKWMRLKSLASFISRRNERADTLMCTMQKLKEIPTCSRTPHLASTTRLLVSFTSRRFSGWSSPTIWFNLNSFWYQFPDLEYPALCGLRTHQSLRSMQRTQRLVNKHCV